MGIIIVGEVESAHGKRAPLLGDEAGSAYDKFRRQTLWKYELIVFLNI